MTMTLEIIGVVSATRVDPDDDGWGGSVSCITLTEGFTAAALQGLTEFSHVEVLYHFHRAEESRIERGARDIHGITRRGPS